MKYIPHFVRSRPIARTALRWAATIVASLFVVSAHAQPLTVGPVNTASRETVRVFFNTVFQASENVPMGWTGNLAGCNPGTISPAYLDATLLRVNFFRGMAGVPSSVTFDPELNRKSQLGALLMTANNALLHDPPMTWTCYTADGAQAAASGNLSLVRTGPQAVFGQMQDWGPDNAAVGHRRWILFPPTLRMGSGSVSTAGPGNAGSTVLWVVGNGAPTRPATRQEYVAWPPPGFVPYPIAFHRWSFSLPEGDFGAATVTMQRAGAPVPVVIQSRGGAMGDPTLVWVPNNLPPADGTRWVRPTADETYTVNVNNVMVGGAARNYTYNVTIFDPAVPGPDYVAPVITGPSGPPLNQNSTYNFTAVPGATGYQWRFSKLTALNLTDGAEAGTGNFDVVVGNYNPVDAEIKATGNAGFRLTRSAGGAEQTLTYKRTLLANANSQLTFKSRLENIAAMAARVEVSTDGGATWEQAFNQNGTEAREGAFTDKVVPLAPFAGKMLQVRFNLVYVGGQFWQCCDPLGWYFDDIAFVNLHEVTPSVVNNVAAGTSFNFNPAEASEFDLNVRPQFFGQHFGEWGPAKRVSTITTAPVAPAIATQPQGQTVTVGANVTFTVVAQGTAPLLYSWQRNGTDLVEGPGIAGSGTPTLTLQNVQAAQAGNYTVRVANAPGNVTSTPAVLVINQPLDLAAALDTTGLNWTTAGNGNWTAQTTVTHDNVDAAKTGTITHNQESRLETMVNGPATVSFWWRVESERDYDFLRVELDGTQQFRITGNVNWEQKTIAVPAGAHTLRWAYAKDGSESVGADAGWVDQVEVRQNATQQQTAPPPSLADALDTTNIIWATTGDRPWFAQTAISRDGTDAVQSGPLADNQSSRLEATILGPANLSFWWKVDSEKDYDFLTFELDNVRPATAERISGTVNWEQKTVPIPAGTHVIRWSYSKDASVGNGADAGWVDQVVLTKLTPGESGEPGPLLEFTASGTKLRITWPEVAADFKLQVATSLPGRDWADVAENDISKEEGEFVVIVNTSGGTKFYRLVELQ